MHKTSLCEDHIRNNDYWGICPFHVVWTNFFLQLFLCGTHRIYFFIFFFINWTVCMSDNLPERVQILGLETCMNSLVKIQPYSKLNFQGKIFFTQNWCNITLNVKYITTVFMTSWRKVINNHGCFVSTHTFVTMIIEESVRFMLCEPIFFCNYSYVFGLNIFT
jgi:hypothetical protein